MGLLILAKFNSMLPLGILFINPSFSILLNSVDNAGLVCKEEIRIAVDEFNPITICKAERSKN